MIANGTIKTIDGDDDIYISLGQICEYLAKSAKNIEREIEESGEGKSPYNRGLKDMAFLYAKEFIELGKFETQRRLINNPEDLLNIIDKNKNHDVE